MQINQSAASTPAYLQITNATSGSATGLEIGLDSGAAAHITELNNQPIIFSSNGGEVMRLVGNGNVGIGLTNPSSHLQVNSPIIGKSIDVADSQIYVRGSDNGYGLAIGALNSPAGAYLQGMVNDAPSTLPLYLNPSGGNVGIGTTSPGQNLQVGDMGSAVANNGVIRVGATNATSSQRSWDFGVSQTTSPYNFYIMDTDMAAPALSISYGSGNVGIGTTSPQTNLHVFGNQYISDGSGGTNTTAKFQVSDSGLNIEADMYSASGSKSITFSTDYNPAMTIQAGTRNVGIGTASPGQKLNVSTSAANDGLVVYGVQTSGTTSAVSLLTNLGTGAFNSEVVSGDAALIYGGPTIGTSAGFVIAPWKNGGGGLRMDNNGNVGIGTTSPISPLHVYNSGLSSFTGSSSGLATIGYSEATQNHFAALDFGQASNVTGYNYPAARIAMQETASGSNLSFGTSNVWANGITNTAMTINYNGNVGIGTTSPTEALEMNGAMNIYGPGYTSSDDGLHLGFISSTHTGQIYSIQNGVAWRPLMIEASPVILNGDNSGKVGIGTTTPGYPLDVQASSFAGIHSLVNSSSLSAPSASGNNLIFGNSNATAGNYSNIWFQDANGHGQGGIGMMYGNHSSTFQGTFYIEPTANSTPKSFVVTSTGNVGIGTTSPSWALTVQATGSAQGAFAVEGSDFVPGTTGSVLRMGPGASSGNTYSGIQAVISGNAGVGLLALNPSGGNVGIGTTSPGEALQVNGAIKSTSSAGTNIANSSALDEMGGGVARLISWGPNATTQGSFEVNLVSSNASVNTVPFYITPTGNVGIGTTSPGDKLTAHVNTGQNIGLSWNVMPQIVSHNDDWSSWGDLGLDNAIFIKANNNVGIGTTSPSRIFDVFDTGAAQGEIMVENNNAGGWGGMFLKNNINGTSGQGGMLSYGGSSNGCFAYTDRVALTSFANSTAGTGSKGISITMEGASEGYQDFRVLNGNAASGTLFTIQQTGNVGIGTTTPTHGNLEINAAGGGTIAFDTNGINSGNITAPNGADLQLTTTRSFAIVTGTNTGFAEFGVNGGLNIGYSSLNMYNIPTNGLVVNGNVGIGTTTPGALLEVYGGSLGTTQGNVSEIARFSGNNGDGSSLSIFQDRYTNGSTWSSASTRIQEMTDVTNQSYIEFNPASGPHALAFGNSSSGSDLEAMRITAAGNVGIGITGPNYPLSFANSLGDKISFYDNGSGNSYGFGIQSSIFQIHTGTPAAITFGYGSSAAMTEFMRISPTGNVGIGTTSPQSTLDVNGNENVTGSIVISGAAGNNFLMSPADTGYQWWMGDFSDALGSYQFVHRKTSDGTWTAPITILTGGNVGIGTASPTKLLHVNGSSLLAGNTYWGTSSQGVLSWDGSNNAFVTATNGLALTSNGSSTPSIFINTASNVGIGTTSPYGKLEIDHSSSQTSYVSASSIDVPLSIRNTSSTASNMEIVSFQDASGYGVANFGAVVTDQTGHSGQLFFATTNAGNISKRMTIDQSGNVGIGTATPDEPLDVNGPIIIEGQGTRAANGSADTGNGYYTRGVGGGSNLTLYNDSNNNINLENPNGQSLYIGTLDSKQTLTVADSGNVGIGTTSPIDLLHVYSASNNALMGVQSGGNSYWAMEAPNGSNVLEIGPLATTHNVTPILTLQVGTGNVGIGTTSPSTKLHVLGTSVTPSSNLADGIFTIGGSSSVRLLFGSDVGPNYGMWMQTTDDSNSGAPRPILLNPVRGNVGIGTTTPSSNNGSVGELLEVAGTTANPNSSVVASSPATSGSLAGGIFEVRSTATLSGGWPNLGQLQFIRNTDVTSGKISSDFEVLLNNNGTIIYPFFINSVGNVGIGSKSHVYISRVS